MIHNILTFKQLIFSIIVIVSASNIQADSLWDQSTIDSFYTSKSRSVSIGDIITVRISEASSAVHEASTSTKKKSKLGTDLLSAWDQVANLLGNENIRKQHELSIEGEDEYNGLGQTSRKSRVRAVVSAVVTEILESGNLFIVGEHRVKINDEVETIRISGIIRPEDIQANNDIYSHQLAKAQVSVHGRGIVGSKQTPGFLTKLLNWLF